MAQLFRLNEKWPYPLMPSEYVQRQFHVSFQDDPVAVACRHITGLSTIVWGNDYPHAEGTFRGSRELMARSSPTSRQTSGPPWSVAPWAGSWGSTLRWPQSKRGGSELQLRGARRGRHGRGTRHRPSLCAPACRQGSQRRRERPGRLHGWPRRRRRSGVCGRGGDRRRRRSCGSPTPAT
jgi:hypothetical protein